jgi:hypothetical protein
MYGVPSDLPLDRFLGKECTLIGVGRFEIRFMFPTTGDICIYGDWEVAEATGSVVDRNQEHSTRVCYFVHKVIDSPVLRYTINAPTSFTLHFENGYSLTVFDNSERYESFSIQPDGIDV